MLLSTAAFSGPSSGGVMDWTPPDLGIRIAVPAHGVWRRRLPGIFSQFVPSGVPHQENGPSRSQHPQPPPRPPPPPPRVLLNNSASPGGGGLTPPTHPLRTPPPLLSDWANFSPGLQPIKNFLWRLQPKSVEAKKFLRRLQQLRVS